VLRGYAAAQDTRASTWAVSGGSATAEVGAAAPTRQRQARRRSPPDIRWPLDRT